MDIGVMGPALCLALSAIGSSIGCSIAGQAAHGAMSRTQEGHGLLIAMSVAPASQSIYGIVLMIFMQRALVSAALSPLAGVILGLFGGLALLLSAAAQGQVCASGIQMSAKDMTLYGKAWMAVGMIESFSLFAFLFTLTLF